MAELPPPYYVEQTVKKEVTIVAGNSSKVSIPIPNNYKAAVKGYGYTWYASNTFQLVVGDVQLPTRTDQEGSASIPRIFEKSITAKGGANVEFRITNGDSVDHTYEVVIYFYLDQYFPDTATYQCQGGALSFNTSTASGTSNNAVIFDATLTTSANVTALGLAVNPSAPTTLLQGSATAAAAGAAIASSTACKKVTLMVDVNAAYDASGYAVFVGNSAGQTYPLTPGQSLDIQVSNLNAVYVKRAGASDATVYYIGA